MNSALRRSACHAVAALCVIGSASGALAAQASAAAIAPNQACYVNANPSVGAPMTILGSGFGPGDPVNIFGGTVNTNTTAGADGSFAAATGGPTLPSFGPATGTTTLTATDENTGATATTTVRAANLAVSVHPASVRRISRQKVTYTFSGFTPGKHIYAYWRKKKVVARLRFGRASGPCGTLREKALMFPGGHPRSSSYSVTFETSKRYSKKAFPQVTEKLSILRF